MIKPIKHLRKILTPPCSTCRHYEGSCCFGRAGSCYSKKYLDHEERVRGLQYLKAENTLVRGTRFCTYEEKEGNDAD
jgi:hypothetical protein